MIGGSIGQVFSMKGTTTGILVSIEPNDLTAKIKDSDGDNVDYDLDLSNEEIDKLANHVGKSLKVNTLTLYSQNPITAEYRKIIGIIEMGSEE